MSEVHEVYSYEYDPKLETLYVEAEVADAVQSCPATLYEPEQWTHGRCHTTIFWDVETDPPLSHENLKNYLNKYQDQNWLLIPFEGADNDEDYSFSSFRNLTNYSM